MVPKFIKIVSGTLLVPFIFSAASVDTKVATLKSPSERFVETQWGITRTQFQNGSHSTSSESFQETWFLKVAGKKLFLTSPRAKVELAGLKFESDDDQSIQSLKLTREQLFKLLGIDFNSDALWQVGVDQPNITLNQSEGGLGTMKSLSFNMANEEQLQIEFKIDTQAK